MSIAVQSLKSSVDYYAKSKATGAYEFKRSIKAQFFNICRRVMQTAQWMRCMTDSVGCDDREIGQ